MNYVRTVIFCESTTVALVPLPPDNDADLLDVGDFSRGGLFWLLRERYETSQERGRVFERLMQYAFRRHPDVYGPARFKNVWRWMEWPDREAYGYLGDVGIDLVAEQTDDWGGGLCAIQTKFNETSQVGKARWIRSCRRQALTFSLIAFWWSLHRCPRTPRRWCPRPPLSATLCTEPILRDGRLTGRSS